jgi:transcriptional regulator with XRE-family HTH domain
LVADEHGEAVGLRKLIGEQVNRLRLIHRWNQQQLSDALGRLGWPLDRTAIARIENGTRNVTVEDLFALAAALGVEAAGLLAPRDDNVEVAVVPGLVRSGARIRGWLHGYARLYRPNDWSDTEADRVFAESMSDQEWRVRQRPIVHGSRTLIRTIEQRAAADDEDGVWAAVDGLREFIEAEVRRSVATRSQDKEE